VGLALAPGPVRAESIGVFFDPEGVTCTVTQAPNTNGIAYILAAPGSGYLSGGISGAEFRLDGMPAAWISIVQPNPEAVLSLGSPVTGGCNISFSSCQSGTNGLVLLYTIRYFVVTTLDSVHLRVTARTTPSNPHWPCPLLMGCEPPDPTVLCVQGGVAAINDPTFCRPAVIQRTWSRVKAVYH
jgi:hypothetical protein